MMRRALLVALLLGLALPLAAAEIPVQNAGFETPALGYEEFTTVVPPGWALWDPDGLVALGTDVADYGVWWPGFFDYSLVQDQQVGFVWLDLAPGSGEFGFVQDLPATLQQQTRYSLEVGVGDASEPPTGGDGSLDGYPGHSVGLWAGDTLVGSDDSSFVNEGQITPVRITRPIGPLHPALGEPLSLRLINRNAAAGIEVDFDAVSLDASPAPLATYRFSVSYDAGSLAGYFVYDTSRNATNQQTPQDATIVIEAATGTLAAFAGLPFNGISASSSLLRLFSSSPGYSLSFAYFGSPWNLQGPLPESGPGANSATFVLADSAQVVFGDTPGASFVVEPVPEPDAAAALLAALGALAARDRRRPRA